MHWRLSCVSTVWRIREWQIEKVSHEEAVLHLRRHPLLDQDTTLIVKEINGQRLIEKMVLVIPQEYPTGRTKGFWTGRELLTFYLKAMRKIWASLVTLVMILFIHLCVVPVYNEHLNEPLGNFSGHHEAHNREDQSLITMLQHQQAMLQKLITQQDLMSEK